MVGLGETSKDWEAMTWADFRELFMSKFFPASVRYAKAREFLRLRQGSMTVLEYIEEDRGRSRGLLFLEDVQYRAAAIRTKARAEVLARQGRLYATIVSNLDM